MSLDDDTPDATARTFEDDGTHSPTCTNCGEREARVHSLRFRREERADRKLDLAVCDRCLERIVDERGVERL